MSWTPERIEEITRLHKEGLSSRRIAMAISRDGQLFTRNAVLGKLTRLGLTSATKPGSKEHREILSSRSAHRVGRIVRRDMPVTTVAQQPFLADGKPYTALTIPFYGACKFPYDSPDVDGGYIFCGQPSSNGPYCEHHRRKCWVPNTKKAA